MKRLILVILLVGLGAGFAAAGSQFDITLNVPYYTGLWSEAGDFGDFANFAFLLPDVKWNYFFGPEWLQFGLGVRLFTFIVESAIYPIVSLESHLGNFVINANVGGGAIAVFGLYNDIFFEWLVFPELSVAYRFGEKKLFSIGTGVFFIFAPEAVGISEFIFTGTAFVRWTF